MSDTSHSTETLTRWQKIKHGTVHETKKFLIATGYLAVWFYAIGLYNQSQLIHLGVDGSDTVFSVTVALIKAAIVGKFLITVEMLLPIKVNKGKPIFWSLLGHSLIYVVLVMILHANALGLEGYLLHGKSFLEGLLEFGHAKPRNLFMIAFIYWLIIAHYLTYFTVQKAIGEKEFKDIFLGK
jgi:hypothetical protein